MTDFNDLDKRRGVLTPKDNPDVSREYLVTYSQQFETKQGVVKLYIAAIPDKYLLPNEVMQQYFKLFSAKNLPDLADLVHFVLNDIANEMIPFWVRVVGRVELDHFSEEIIAEDIQPKWNNKPLIQMAKTSLA